MVGMKVIVLPWRTVSAYEPHAIRIEMALYLSKHPDELWANRACFERNSTAEEAIDLSPGNRGRYPPVTQGLDVKRSATMFIVEAQHPMILNTQR
jgi:hypothetical protein